MRAEVLATRAATTSATTSKLCRRAALGAVLGGAEHRPSHCLVVDAADGGGSPETAQVVIGSDDVHAFPLSLQWSVLRVVGAGWVPTPWPPGGQRLVDPQRGVGTSTWPRAGTSSWPHVGIFSWPWTAVTPYSVGLVLEQGERPWVQVPAYCSLDALAPVWCEPPKRGDLHPLPPVGDWLVTNHRIAGRCNRGLLRWWRWGEIVG